MNRITEIPFIKIIPFFVLGILINEYTGFVSIGSLALCISLFISTLLLAKYRRKIPIRTLCISLLVTSGFIHNNSNKIYIESIKKTLDHAQQIRGRLGQRKVNGEGVRYYFHINSIRTKKGVSIDLKTKSKVLLFLREDIQMNPNIQSSVIINNPDIHISKNQTDEFSIWMSRNSVLGSLWTTGEDIEIRKEKKQDIVNNYRIKLRRQIDVLFHSPEVHGIAQALLLGDKSSISDDLRQIYTKSGAIHILTVSGLHATIVFSIPLSLLALLRFPKRMRYILSLLTVYIFTLLCGAIPSLLRASLMLSLYTISKWLGKQNNPYNILLACAFILILNKPSIIYNISFQLSFSAVYGIMAFFKTYQQLYRPKRKIAIAVRDMLAVSLAAQTGTLGFSLLHFHQFPLVFLLSTLLVIPLAPIIILSLFSTVCINLLSAKGALVFAGAIEYIVSIQNTLLTKMASQEWLYIEDIPFTTIDCMTYYAILIVINIREKGIIWITAILLIYLSSASLILENKKLNYNSVKIIESNDKLLIQRSIYGLTDEQEIDLLQLDKDILKEGSLRYCVDK